MPRALPRLVAGLSMAILAVACSSATGATTAPTAPASAAPSLAASTAASGAPASAATGARVSANSASESEIAAALTAAGVPNGARWAREVVEYRPYDASDATLQKLQDNLAKYNPDAATLAGILGALTP